jgi:tRNA (cytidine/uridine-2'-O-)-methyltransferase
MFEAGFPSFHVVLYQPQIPHNTGSLIRLCANTGAHLHLIEPLGFVLDDKHLKRSGLDYHEWAQVKTHVDVGACLAELGTSGRHYMLSSKTERAYTAAAFKPGDVLWFGSETQGLPDVLWSDDTFAPLTIPMRSGARCLNLAQSVAIVLYEAIRQSA